MKIIFVGSTGVHHSLIAANIYLEKLDQADYQNLNLWGDLDKEALGFPIFVNNDRWGNSVYSLGVGADVLMVVKSIKQLVKMLNCSERDLIVTPVFIKRERLVLLLHTVGCNKFLNQIFLPIIGYLLKKEFAFIRQQVREFKSGADLPKCHFRH